MVQRKNVFNILNSKANFEKLRKFPNYLGFVKKNFNAKQIAYL